MVGVRWWPLVLPYEWVALLCFFALIFSTKHGNIVSGNMHATMMKRWWWRGELRQRGGRPTNGRRPFLSVKNDEKTSKSSGGHVVYTLPTEVQADSYKEDRGSECSILRLPSYLERPSLPDSYMILTYKRDMGTFDDFKTISNKSSYNR